MELWIKKYLTLFVDFFNYGNILWLAIPLLVFYLITIKKRKRWELALIFVFVSSCLALHISSKARSNPRYLLTLVPFTTGAIFLSIWAIIKKKNKYLRITLFIICGILISLNYYHARDYYFDYWRFRVSVVDSHFPYKMLKYINDAEDINPKQLVLVYSPRCLFYYHTNKKGIYYQDPRVNIINWGKNPEKVLDVLKNELGIKYILINLTLAPNQILENIVANYCDLVVKEEGEELLLYRIREKQLSKKELEGLFINNSVLQNGSFELWSQGTLGSPDYFDDGDHVIKGMVTREEKEIKVGKYSAKITGDNFNFTQNIDNYLDYLGDEITLFVWIKTNVPDKYRAQIYDGIDSSFSHRHSGSGKWELFQVNHKVNSSADCLTVRVIQADRTKESDDTVYVDGALLIDGYWNTFFLYALHVKQNGSI